MFIKITVASLALLWMTASQSTVDTTISLQDAVRQGKVKVAVQSNGGATGNWVRVEVQRLVPESLTIEVTPGTVLINSVNAEQNVVVGQLKGEFTGENKYRKGSVMVLADGKTRSFLLEIYCLDYAKKAPHKGGTLELAMPDMRVARILSPPPNLTPSLAATQIAIWMDRAGITADEARKRTRLATTEVDVQVARQLLVHAEKVGVETIPDDMPASVKVHVTKLFSTNPELRAQAAQALGQLGAEAQSAVSFLAENMLDPSTDKPLPLSVVRADVDAALGTAAETLERLGMPALAPLIESLREGTAGPDAQGAAEVARGMVGDIVIDGMIRRLKNATPAVRARTAVILGRSGSQRAIEPLIGLLEDESERVRSAAAEALKPLTGQEFGTDVQRWRQWLKERQQP